MGLDSGTGQLLVGYRFHFKMVLCLGKIVEGN